MIPKRKLTLVGLFLVFFIPLLISTVLYFGEYELNVKSHGELITPVQPLPSLLLAEEKQAPSGQPISRHKWTVLYWDTMSACDLYCEAALFKIRQVRLSLGKYIGRAQTMYLTPDTSMLSVEKLKQRNPVLIFASSKNINAALIRQMRENPSGYIYLIDNFGNLVMRYSDESNSKGILRDLKKLLSVSRNVR